MLLRVTLLVALAFAALPARACRLALALGFDVSRSVDAQDYRLQIDGILAALFDPEIRGLILEGSAPVAMAVFEWAGTREHLLVADWALLDSPAAIDRLAQQVLVHQRQAQGLTAVGSALSYARALLDRAPDCLWHTLDMAGDGQNNQGDEPQRVYAAEDFSEITVNGLAIGAHESGVLRWFQANLLHGPGAFAEYAPTHEAFAETFRRKLIRELSEHVIGALPGRLPSGQPAEGPGQFRHAVLGIPAAMRQDHPLGPPVDHPGDGLPRRLAPLAEGAAHVDRRLAVGVEVARHEQQRHHPG